MLLDWDATDRLTIRVHVEDRYDRSEQQRRNWR